MKKVFWISLLGYLVLSSLFLSSLADSLGSPIHYFSIVDVIESLVISLILSGITVVLALIVKKLTSMCQNIAEK